MRISKLYLPAAAMAGAVALAGCGGGDGDSMTNMNMENGKENGGGAGGFSVADLPEGASFVYDEDSRETVTVGKGSAPIRGSINLSVRCEDDDGCQYRVRANSIETTNGATVVLTSSLTTPTGGATDRPTDSTDPLSNDVLLKALNETRPGNQTAWNIGESNPVLTNDGTEQSITPLGGPRIDLHVIAVGDSNAAYFGHWAKVNEPVGNPEVVAQRGTVWGGATPYGQKPEVSLGEAEYDATDSVLLYFKNGTADWATITNGGLADLSLTANFSTGKVGGEITGVTESTASVFPDRIVLKETDIGSAGTFSGSAEFHGSTVSRKSGDWNGGFFGSTVTGTAIQAHEEPGHVAGEFRVAGRVGTADLRVNGAFGAACSTGCD